MKLLPWCVLAFVVLAASPGQAQTRSTVDVSGGYQLLHVASNVDETLAKGWYADLSAELIRPLRLVIQAGGNYKSLEQSITIRGVTTQLTGDLKVHEFMGGVRFQPGSNGPVTAFGQALVGAVNGSATVSGSVTTGSIDFLAANGSSSSTEFAMQFGGGVNVRMTDRVGVRAGADYIRVFSDGGGNVFRLGIGAVFPF